jgi:hypothetical protein
MHQELKKYAGVICASLCTTCADAVTTCCRCCCCCPAAQVTASGYLNWGNVHLCRGHKALDVAALAGQALSQELLDKVRGDGGAASLALCWSASYVCLCACVVGGGLGGIRRSSARSCWTRRCPSGGWVAVSLAVVCLHVGDTWCCQHRLSYRLRDVCH